MKYLLTLTKCNQTIFVRAKSSSVVIIKHFINNWSVYIKVDHIIIIGQLIVRIVLKYRYVSSLKAKIRPIEVFGI